MNGFVPIRWIILSLVLIICSLGCSHTWEGLKETGHGLAETGRGMVADTKKMMPKVEKTDESFQENWW